MAVTPGTASAVSRALGMLGGSGAFDEEGEQKKPSRMAEIAQKAGRANEIIKAVRAVRAPTAAGGGGGGPPPGGGEMSYKMRRMREIEFMRVGKPTMPPTPPGGPPSSGGSGGMLSGMLGKAGAFASAHPIATTIAAGAAIAYTLVKLGPALERFSSGIMESQRGLVKFGGGIQVAFASLERQQLILGARTAKSTGGSTQELGRQIMQAREALQPLREVAITLKNIAGMGLADLAEIVGNTTNGILTLTGIKAGMDLINSHLGGGGASAAQDWRDFFESVSSGRYDMQDRKTSKGQKIGSAAKESAEVIKDSLLYGVLGQIGKLSR